MIKIFHNLLLLICISHLSIAQSLQEQYAKANEAYEKGDYATFLKSMQQVDELRPNHPTVLYNLSIAYAKNNFTHQALRTLERVIWMNTSYPFEIDTSFNSIKKLEAFESLVTLKRGLLMPFRTSKEFRKIDKKYITHAEGITYHKRSDSFFLGDVRERKIIKVSPNGMVSDFANGAELLSILGMDVDEQRGLLWVCSSPMDEMLKREGETKQHARLLSFDIKTGKAVHKAISESPEALFGDLIIAKNGDVYTTSSSAAHAGIYKFDIKKQKLELFHLFEDLVSLQGLTFDEKQGNLFFSDYREGLFKLNLESGIRTKLMNYSWQSLKGVDGLYRHNNRLIAIQNGLKPYQVTAYQLNSDHTALLSFEHLDRALPEMGEPTLGTLVDGKFYYIESFAKPTFLLRANTLN